MTAADQNRYTAVAITLHWMIALGIIGMIGLGWYMGDVQDRAEQYALIQLHKSFGISILLLSIARLIWRVMNPPPADPPMPAWQATAARATHIAFYVLIIAMPLTGWIMVSASPTGIPTKLFQTIPWSHLPVLAGMSSDAKEAFKGPIEFVHSKIAWVAIVLLVLHVGAALKHQLIDRDNLLARMIPGVFGKTSGPPAPARGAIAAFGAAFIIFAVAAAASLLTGSKPDDPAIAPEVTTTPATPTNAPAPSSSDTSEDTPAAQASPTEPASGPEIAPPAQTETAATPAEIAPTENPDPAQSTPSPVPTWTVDHANSTLGFTAAYMGRAFSGKFDNWTAAIAFDPDRPEETDIRVDIVMSSVNTGEPFYDENVVLGDWFNTSSFPQAVFKADSASSLGDGRYSANGALTIKQSTQPLTVNFALNIDGQRATVDGSATIQRLDFAIGADTLTEPRGDEDWVANDVQIVIDLVANQN